MEFSRFLTDMLGVEVYYYEGRYWVEQEDETLAPYTSYELVELMNSKDPIIQAEEYYNETEYELDLEDYTG